MKGRSAQPPEGNSDSTITNSWLTIPNAVTLARFLLVPVFVWFMFHDEYWIALITLIVLFSTDWIDGFLARILNQRSTVGQWLDPLADRLSLWVVVITVVLSGLAPLWLIFALVVPDLLLAGVMAVIYAGNPKMRVTLLGKARTAALMVGVPFLLFAEAPFLEDPQVWHTLAIVILAVGALGHILASMDYLFHGIQNARKMRKANLDPRNKTDRDTFLESV
ncbi:CDP-alcohol phosphatidyltransferase family protein [Enteractinococcus fodinae]|uniref:Cardiolipin synthase n=1 Tax=Enteractinococcus fodinae TaxID=684663 RepID=A0ABU2B1F5_9MICC|nr:CDP-alcohol phosphatidyltransferase family protein [Enteractinococcus fodinae]MDR7347445.1 cardiolipin synthase [Enteractinococcus fodinae]